MGTFLLSTLLQQTLNRRHFMMLSGQFVLLLEWSQNNSTIATALDVAPTAPEAGESSYGQGDYGRGGYSQVAARIYLPLIVKEAL